MMKNYPSENWKNVAFDLEFSNEFRMEVSNFGRIRTFNKISNGNILKGSMINGYRIVRLKFFKAKEEKAQKEIDSLRLNVAALSKQLKSLTYSPLIESTKVELEDLKKKLAKKVRTDEKKRTIYYHSLIHRLVATYFLSPPTKEQTVVAHLDHNKLNNRSYNLKWMTAEENYAHQKHSPLVIAEKESRMYKKESHTTKLSVTKVMLLKKLLNQNKPIRQLAKQFRVTDTQIIRIKKGENWAEIEAAK